MCFSHIWICFAIELATTGDISLVLALRYTVNLLASDKNITVENQCKFLVFEKQYSFHFYCIVILKHTLGET